MKKFILLCSQIIMAVGLFAQIPNADMENWSNAPQLTDWETNSYPLTLPPWDPYIVRKDSDEYSGNWAANLFGNGQFKAYAKTTFAVAQHPAQLSLYYKLIFPPCVNDANFPEKDTVSINIELLNNGVVVDSGFWQSTQNNYSYSQLLLPFSQGASSFDSCRITVWGGKVFGGCGFAPAGTEFKVDHFELKYSAQGGCVDSSQICDSCACPAVVEPVCGCDGKTYGNFCEAYNKGVTNWTQGPCNNCIDSNAINPNVACPFIFDPVCGCDGNTYSNSCVALYQHGVTSWTPGECSQCAAVYTFNLIDSTAKFFDGSYTTTGNIVNWLYSFDDGTTDTAASPIHTFPGPDTFNVCLTITSSSGCTNTVCQQIVVAAVGCIDTSSLCPNCPCPGVYNPVCGCNGITYSNACYASNAGVTSWDSGACNSYCKADFFHSRYLDTVAFYNASITGGPGVYQWDFGDGTTDTAYNPLHVYAADSTYLVCLTVYSTDTAGQPCVVTHCQTIYYSKACTDSSLLCGFELCCDFVPNIPVCGCDSVTYPNACVAQSLHGIVYYYVGSCVTGIRDIESEVQKISIVPNPASNTTELRFELQQNALIEIELQNIMGEVVSQYSSASFKRVINNMQLDLSSFSAGIYLVTIKANGRSVAVRKLVKQ